jgi:hypothetical protein
VADTPVFVNPILLRKKGELDPNAKAILLSSTNRIEWLRSLFGMVDNNYKKLAEAA